MKAVNLLSLAKEAPMPGCWMLLVAAFLHCAAFAAPMPPVIVDVQKIDKAVEPVPMIERFAFEAKGGMLLRDGRPFYWISDGNECGGVHATPLGLWLSKLHGTTLASILHSSAIVRGSERGDGVHIAPDLCESSFSWLREAIRLGFLTQCPEGFFRPESIMSLSPLLAKYPELRESIYDHGHHMGADPGSDLGLAVLDAKRYPLFAYGAKTGFFMPELNRESGPDPYNERVKRGFREWARRKYGTLDEANAVWRTSFASWEDVVLNHTTGTGATDSSCYTNTVYGGNVGPVMRVRNERARLRAIERRDQPEMYWDWMQYVQADTTDFTRREFEHARRFAPGALFGIDVRGHHHARDNYVSHDPVAVDAMADVFYVHYGFNAYDYSGRHFEPKTLHDAICWPLFTCRYFRCNTTKPIVNVEDIIGDTIAAAPSEAAMEANDLSKFRERKITVKRRGDGGGRLYFEFEMNPRLEADRADGSARFYLAGRAPEAFGASINGKELGYFGKAGSMFQLDVTDALDFNGLNKVEFRYDGLNKIPENDDPKCHILTQKTLGENGVFGKKQYKSMFWSYLAEGQSAAIIWHWNRGERLRLYQAAMSKNLAAAAQIVLPAIRFKKEKVAFLYSYMAGAGLPAAVENRHHELMDWAGALEFTGRRFDVLGEERFRQTAAQYPVVVAPDIWCVYGETLEAAKRYVREGGTLVVTPGSLGKTFERYRDSGFDQFAKGGTGKGRVVILENGLGMEALAEKLAPYLPAPELDVRFLPSAEFPCVERLLAGDAKRKVLYLQNWGGCDQTCVVDLPAECSGWRLTPLEGRFKKTPEGRIAVKVEGSQGMAACILSAPGAEIPEFRLSARENARLKRVRDIMTFGRPAPGRKRVLFPLDGPGGLRHAYSGVEIFPHLVEAVRALGAEADAVPPAEWTRELLSKYAAVVVTEGNSLEYWEKLFSNPDFRAMLVDYLNGGGALFAAVDNSHSSLCANAEFARLSREAWNLDMPRGTVPRDETSHGFGDPRQILTGNISSHPIAEGVNKVQLFALMPLNIMPGSQMEAVVSLPRTSTRPDAPVMVAQKFGKGRVAVTAEPMAFQPYRIGEADNAALLLNTFAWLLGEKATPETRASFRKQCMRLTE